MGPERMDGEEGVTGTPLLCPRDQQGLDGAPPESAGCGGSVDCVLVPAREIEAPERLLTQPPLGHHHCCTRGGPPPLRND